MKAYLNGQEYAFEEGETILQLARRAGVFIPTLCRFEPLAHKPATCRVCIVEVSDDKGTRMVASCETPLADGMRIDTFSRHVRDMQRTQVEMIFADHDQECVSCARHGDCELQDLGEAVGLARNRFLHRLRPRHGHDARHAQVHPLPALCGGLPPDPGRGRPHRGRQRPGRLHRRGHGG